MKYCTWCKKEKPLTRFSKRTYRSGKVGYQTKCKDCERVCKKKYYKPNENMRRQLGITDEKYDQLIEESNGMCSICDREMKKICLDHDHSSGKFRGLLCNNCNTALGLVGDNVDTLHKMINYLGINS